MTPGTIILTLCGMSNVRVVGARDLFNSSFMSVDATGTKLKVNNPESLDYLVHNRKQAVWKPRMTLADSSHRTRTVSNQAAF